MCATTLLINYMHKTVYHEGRHLTVLVLTQTNVVLGG